MNYFPSPYNALAVLNWFLDRSWQSGFTLTERKAHLLLYFAQGVHAAVHKAPLVGSFFEASRSGGPMSLAVKKHFGGRYLQEAIPFYALEMQVDPSGEVSWKKFEESFSREALSSLEAVWQAFGEKSDVDLRGFATKRDSPWASAVKIKDGSIIRADELGPYFSQFVSPSMAP